MPDSTRLTLDLVDAAPRGFDCEWIGGPGAGVVRLRGELDISSARELGQMLQEALGAERVVILDLRGLSFMDAAGMRVVLLAHVQARSEDRRLVVVRGPSHVDSVFTMSRTDGLLETVALTPSEPASRAVPSRSWNQVGVGSVAPRSRGRLRSERWVRRPAVRTLRLVAPIKGAARSE